MGSERKSKKRRSPSNSPSQEDEKDRSEKRHKSSSSSKREKRKEDKEEGKSKKSHKHSKHSSDKGKKSDEKHDRKRPKYNSEVQELSKDDYFSKNNEFATWLKEERGVFFSDLSSEASRELFLKFIKAWNNKKLESRYYEGISTGPRTAHKWKITTEKRS